MVMAENAAPPARRRWLANGHRDVVTLLVPALAAVVAGYPILGNGLYGDDYLHLIELATAGPREMLLAPVAGHMCLVRNFIFYLCYLAFGVEPLGYFIIALATHVLASVLVAAVSRRVTGDALVSCLAGVLFAVAPTNQGTIGYYSVYGHALAAVLVLLALLVVTPMAGDTSPLRPRAAVLAASLVLAASQCFGTGAAVAVVFPVVAVLLRPAILRDVRVCAIVVSIPVVVLASWFAMNATRTRLNPMGIKAVVFWAMAASHMRDIAHVGGHLFGIGIDGLLLGAASLETAYGAAPSVVAIVAFVLAVSATLLLSGGRTRRALLACLTAAGSCYAAVAAGRAAYIVAAYPGDQLLTTLENSPRFHYLAQAILAIVVALALAEVRRRLTRPGAVAVAVSAWIAWAVASTAALTPAAVRPGDVERTTIARARSQLEEAIRREPPGATVCLLVKPVPITSLVQEPSVVVYLLWYPSDEFEGRRVRFVSSDPKVLALRDRGGRIQRLLLWRWRCPGIVR